MHSRREAGATAEYFVVGIIGLLVLLVMMWVRLRWLQKKWRRQQAATIDIDRLHASASASGGVSGSGSTAVVGHSTLHATSFSDLHVEYSGRPSLSLSQRSKRRKATTRVFGVGRSLSTRRLVNEASPGSHVSDASSNDASSDDDDNDNDPSSRLSWDAGAIAIPLQPIAPPASPHLYQHHNQMQRIHTPPIPSLPRSTVVSPFNHIRSPSMSSTTAKPGPPSLNLSIDTRRQRSLASTMSSSHKSSATEINASHRLLFNTPDLHSPVYRTPPTASTLAAVNVNSSLPGTMLLRLESLPLKSPTESTMQISASGNDTETSEDFDDHPAVDNSAKASTDPLSVLATHGRVSLNSVLTTATNESLSQYLTTSNS